MVIPYGHEVASHGLSHKKEDGFDILSNKEQIEHLKISKNILEDISGQKVVSFRAPALRVKNDITKSLEQTGYLYDSSVASQRFDAFLSFGALKKLNWLLSPRLPYRASKNNIFSRGNSGIIEIPISALILPYIGTTMRILPNLTKLQRRILAFESKLTSKPINFDIHPNEFIDESSERRDVEIRSKNFLSGVFQDRFRSWLKLKNLGKDGFKLYRDQLQFFKENNFKFSTIKEYGAKLNL